MPEVLEGDWPGRVVVLEFPDLDQVRAWYDSPEYRAAREVRKSGVTVRLVFAEGGCDRLGRAAADNVRFCRIQRDGRGRCAAAPNIRHCR